MSDVMAQTALWVMLLTPAVVGAALALSGLERSAAVISVATAGVTAALSGVVALTRPAASTPFVMGADLAVGVDALSALIVPTVATITLLVLVFSAGEIGTSRGRFHGLMLVFASAVLLTACAQNLPTLLLGWEVMGAMSYALIGFRWHEAAHVTAGNTAFVTTRAADLGLYVAAGAALAAGAGWADLSGLASAAGPWRDIAAAGVLVAALGKSAQLPFSFWLSRAMVGPSPVSALLHSAAMVAMGGYLVLRMQPLLAATGWAATVAAWAGALTALLLGAVAVGQRDLKQLLAASTSAQLGFVVMGAGLGAVSGASAHLVAHGATKALLFLAAGAWLTALGTKHLAGLCGVARRWPVVGWTATVAALSLAGVPPLALWATKDAVLGAALRDSPALYAVGLAAAALSAAYAGMILVTVWSRASDATRRTHLDEEQPGSRHVGSLAQAPLVALAVGAATLGLLALPPLGDLLARALGRSQSHPGGVEMLASALVALAVLAAVWRHRDRVPQPGWARAWLGLDDAAQTLFLRPTLALAQRLARFDERALDSVVTAGAHRVLAIGRAATRFDDRTLDATVEATARAGTRAAHRSATIDDARLDGVVEAMASWARGLGNLARRPQTGLVHTYYIQAVAVLAIGVLLVAAWPR